MFNLGYILLGFAMFAIGAILASNGVFVFGVPAMLAGAFFVLLGAAAQARGIK